MNKPDRSTRPLCYQRRLREGWARGHSGQILRKTSSLRAAYCLSQGGNNSDLCRAEQTKLFAVLTLYNNGKEQVISSPEFLLKAHTTSSNIKWGDLACLNKTNESREIALTIERTPRTLVGSNFEESLSTIADVLFTIASPKLSLCSKPRSVLPSTSIGDT